MSILNCKAYTLVFGLWLGSFLALPAQVNQIPFEEDSWFTRFGYEEGYPEGIVLDMLQDEQGFLWIATADGLFKYDGYKFTEYRVKTKSKSGLRSNVIRSVAKVGQVLYLTSNEGTAWTELDLSTEDIQNRNSQETWIPTNNINQFYRDKENRLWMASDAGLLMKPPGQDTLLQYLPAQGLASRQVNNVFGTADGNLWIQTDLGLDVFDPVAEKFQTVDWPFLQENTIRAFFEDNSGILWVGTSKGLYQIDRPGNSIQRIGARGALQLSSQSVRAITKGADGRLYVGTIDGLNALDFQNNQNEIFQSEAESRQYISEDRVSCLFSDRQGLLWIGTWGRELQYLNFQKPPFQYLRVPLAESNNINAIEHTDSTLWMGTEYNGLVRLNLRTGDFKSWSDKNGLESFQIYALEVWKDKLWIGQGLNGHLACMDPITEQLSIFTPENTNLPDEEIWAITIDQNNHLWIAGERSLYEIEGLRSDGRLVLGDRYRTLINEAGEAFEIRPRSLVVDQNNQLWVGTSNHGLVKLDPVSGDYTLYSADPGDAASCPGDYVNTVYLDQKGRIWVGTAQGLGILDEAQGDFKVIAEEDGLPNNYVFTIFEDPTGYFWFSTNRGLVRYCPPDEDLRAFTVREGLPINEFNKSAAMFWEGEIYYGTINGLVLLYPERIVQNTYVPPVVFTDLMYRNRKSNAPAIEEKAVAYRDEIELSYLENILEIEFAALNYLQSSKNRYRYQLKGFSNNWVDLGERRSITFSGLEPGLYTLKVQGSNNDGVWNYEGASLKIRIIPPIWKTSLAYFSYILVSLLLLVFVYRYSVGMKMAKEEERRKKELDKAKTRFFTNIAHEFKNPLTIMMSMAQELKGHEQVGSTIIRHGSDIRRLINQVLDLRRLENDQLPVEMVQLDMVDFSRQLTTSFEPFARQQAVDLRFSTTAGQIMMDTDREKWMAILSNLISNAIKYNQEGGEVEVNLTQEQAFLKVEVRDTGRGIPEEALPHVFERFYQVDDSARTVGGTGVGLALVKEFIKLLDGEVWVESRFGEGTCFYIKLPIRQTGRIYTSQEKVDYEMPLVAPTPPKIYPAQLENTMLIVEDNSEILSYLKEKFAKYFTVISATDGEKGISMAIEQVPDIIISDIMMPKKDGVELLETLKNDERTSHIPIILLTAKSAVDDRIRGLEKGADRYLGKPFLLDELWAHIQGLLNNREKMQRYYLRQLEGRGTDNEPIDPFLEKAQKAVLDHLADEDFNVIRLCNVLSISRTQLHQKLRATIGKSTTHFMNEIRLREGRKLLVKSDLNVSEIAYSVGFKDPSYFSARYKEIYGETPTETRK